LIGAAAIPVVDFSPIIMRGCYDTIVTFVGPAELVAIAIPETPMLS
jgi:hypothetical protein